MRRFEENKLKCEGKLFLSNSYGDFKVIRYNGTFNVDIEFVSTGTKSNVSLGNILKGSVKDPYFPSIYGVGFIGRGIYTSRVNSVQTTAYKRWKEMLNRCYNTKNAEFNNYGNKGVTVCNEWLNFQNYAEWYNNNCLDETFVVDKDILNKGCKIYSPDTCCFVPSEINTALTSRKNERGKYPIGVRMKDGKIIAQINYMKKKIHLGTFNTVEEAFNAYKNSKEKCLKEYADLYKNKISKEVYNALYNYKVEITD